MVSIKPSELTVNLCNMAKILKIASAHNWNIISVNFVRRTKEVAGQSVSQLKIFISRLATRENQNKMPGNRGTPLPPPIPNCVGGGPHCPPPHPWLWVKIPLQAQSFAK